jgi:hypothetical protein
MSSDETLSGSKRLPVVKLVDSFEASFSCVANEGPRFVFTTNLNAPRYRYSVKCVHAADAVIKTGRFSHPENFK